MSLTKTELISESVLDNAMGAVLEAGTNIVITHNPHTHKLAIHAPNSSSSPFVDIGLASGSSSDYGLITEAVDTIVNCGKLSYLVD